MRRALHRFFRSILTLTCLGYAVFLVFPLLLFSQNDAEFGSGFLDLLAQEALPLCAAIAGLSIILALLPDSVFGMALSLVLALLLLVYIQGSFLVWDYGPFNGEPINWDDFWKAGLIENALWAGLLPFALIFHRPIVKAQAFILFFVVLALSLGSATELGGKDFKLRTAARTEQSDSLYRFSSKRNILLIILDTFSTPAFEAITRKDPDLGRPFDGFTFFPDTLAAFTTTEAAIPAILSGIEYDNSEPIKSYLSRTMSEQSLPSMFFDRGYQVDVMSMPQLCGRIKGSCFTINKVVAKDAGQIERRELLELLDLTLFRTTPQALKKRIYNKQRWFLQRVFGKEGSPRSLFNSVDFVGLFEHQASASANQPTFKFIHLMLPHGPFRFNAKCAVVEKEDRSGNHRKEYEAQASCALRLVGRMLETLKRLGIYEDSLIFVAADHGYILKYLPFSASKEFILPEPAMPLLLLKPFGENASRALSVSNAPASLIDIPKTVADAAGLEFQFQGESLLKLGEDSNRQRRYRAYRWKDDYWKGKYLPNMQEFLISGAVRDPHSWSKGSLYSAAEN